MAFGTAVKAQTDAPWHPFVQVFNENKIGIEADPSIALKSSNTRYSKRLIHDSLGEIDRILWQAAKVVANVKDHLFSFPLLRWNGSLASRGGCRKKVLGQHTGTEGSRIDPFCSGFTFDQFLDGFWQ